MDGATLQARVYRGYAIGAPKIGLSYTQYRPTLAANPITVAQQLRTLKASFNAEDFKYMKANKYGHPTWFGIFDGSLTQPGDYMVGPGGTFFIAAQQALLPILCVETNRRVKVSRITQVSAVGAVGYSGNCAHTDTDLIGGGSGGSFTGWPASIEFGGRTIKESPLPGSTHEQGWQILLPPSLPVSLRSGDIVIDDLARRYSVVGAEQTDLGWRLNTVEAHS